MRFRSLICIVALLCAALLAHALPFSFWKGESIAIAPPPPPDLPAPFLFYNFEADGFEQLSTGFDLTNDTGVVSYTSGKHGNAADFDGASNLKVDPATFVNENLYGGSMTVSAWVNLRSGGDSRWLTIWDSFITYWFLPYHDSGTAHVLVSGLDLTGASGILTNEWHLWTISIDHGVSASLYIDETLIDSQAYTSFDTAVTPVFTVGNSDGGGLADALVDSLGIWTNAFSAALITNLFNSGAGRYYSGGWIP